MIGRALATLLLLVAATAPAFAHLDPAGHGSFAAGLTHPLSGLDHVLAMAAVGLWAALLASRSGRERALWLVPSAFLGAMTLGFLAAIAGLPLPFVEPAILASVIVTGLLAAAALSVPVPAAMVIAGLFALFHGHAHGGEIGAAIAYAAGFVAATALLHAAGAGAGLSLGRAFGSGAGRLLTRAAGAVVALGGAWLALAG